MALGACAAGLALLTIVPSLRPVAAQNRMGFSPVSAQSGHTALGLAVRKLSVAGTFMQAPAHPDDETNSVLALHGLGMGLRTVDLQNNRGDGGQNEIGPELFRDIAVLRTSELLSVHRIDGAEQFFTRAIDYGYSFDPEEVISKWGRKEIVGDYVRFLRTIRPDVLLTMSIQGTGGDRAHEATTVLVREAYKLAGDPNQYPEQIAEGLRPWQPKKLYFPAGNGAIPAGGPGGVAAGAVPQSRALAADAKLARLNVNAYDELLGRTYNEIGTDARTNHRCQGMAGLPVLPGAAGGRGGPPAGTYVMVDASDPSLMGKDETSFFDNLDVSIPALARFAAPNPPYALTAGLALIADAATRAQQAFAAGHDAATAAPIEEGLNAIRQLRAQLGAIQMSDLARYEIDFRLKTKERDYEDALLAAHGLTFEAVADDGLVIPGQPVKVSVYAINHGATDVAVSSVAFAGFDSPGACKADTAKKDAFFKCDIDARIPKDAKPTTPYFHDEYWKHPENPAIQIFDKDVPFGVPFAPSPFRVTFHLKAGKTDVTREMPVQYRYVKDIFNGDKRMELNVVPPFSVRVQPTLVVIPASAPTRREIRVTVTNDTKGAAQVSVALELPAGWKSSPETVPVNFGHEDEALSARFEVTPPAQAKVGEISVRAVVTSAAMPGEKFSDGFQEIEYPHIQRRQVMKPAETLVKVVDVKTLPNINVGYINGVGDQVPPALEQLGAKVTFIDENELSGGDLAKYDVVITGVRAYERRGDLRAYNQRLLDYVNRGGTVIVQYNKFEFNQGQYGPWPVKVSGNRISDENVPVKILQPAHPVFNFPNKINDATWAHWTLERGLYFLGERDPKYVDLVSMTDSFRDNPGEKLGSLVEARAGKGRWIYLGLGLWRQLPAGTDGAYQLLANLISLPKAPASKR